MTTDKPTPRLIVREQLAHVARRVRKTAKSPDDPKPVHDLRVAIRHFSQALRLFPEAFEHSYGKKVRLQLKKLMSLLGAVRNHDIAPEVLDAAQAAPQEALLKALTDHRQTEQKHLMTLLKSWLHRDLLHEWKSKMLRNAGGARSFESARLGLSGLAGEFFQAGNYAARHKVAYRRLHRCRLLGKRFRYSVELFGLAETPQFKSRFKVLKRLQDQLGALNDTVTVIGLIPGHAAVKKRLRLLRTQQEQAFRSYWIHKFDLSVQEWWLHALIPQSIPIKASQPRRTKP